MAPEIRGSPRASVHRALSGMRDSSGDFPRERMRAPPGPAQMRTRGHMLVEYPFFIGIACIMAGNYHREELWCKGEQRVSHAASTQICTECSCG